MSLNSHALKPTYFLQTEASIQTLAPKPELPKESMVLKMIVRSLKKGGRRSFLHLASMVADDQSYTFCGGRKSSCGIYGLVLRAWDLKIFPHESFSARCVPRRQLRVVGGCPCECMVVCPQTCLQHDHHIRKFPTYTP